VHYSGAEPLKAGTETHHIALQEQADAGDDVLMEVIADGLQRVLLEGAPYATPLALVLLRHDAAQSTSQLSSPGRNTLTFMHELLNDGLDLDMQALQIEKTDHSVSGHLKMELVRATPEQSKPVPTKSS
jgi:hypothetical protein